MLQLQSQLDDAISERDSLEQSKGLLQKLTTEKSLKLEETLGRLKEAKDELIEKEEVFRKEMTTQTKLSKLYKTSLDESQAKNSHLEEELQERETALRKAQQDIQDLREERAKFQETHGAKLIEKDKELDTLRAQLRHANELLAAVSIPQPQQTTDILSSTAQAASRLQKSGLSFTQVVRFSSSLFSLCFPLCSLMLSLISPSLLLLFSTPSILKPMRVW